MREILFRGIPKREADFHFFKIAYPMSCEGNFVIGSLLYEAITNRYYIVNAILAKIYCTVGNAQCTAVEVDPATVGQFTGLVDKNGKKVFEGDILSIECYDGGSLFEPSCTWHENAEVIWSQEHFGWYAKFADEELSLWEYDDSETIEVIGNVHDNPELWKEDQ